MKGLMILIKGAFKANIKQTLILLMVMTLTATMLLTAFALLYTTNHTVENVLNEHNTSHLTLWFDARDHQADDIRTFFDEDERVLATSQQSMLFFEGTMVVNERSVRTNEVVLADHSTADEAVNTLKLISGESLNTQARGIWVSSAFAYGENITLGDALHLQSAGHVFEFEVIGIVFDPIYSSEFMPPRFWVSHDDFNMMKTPQQLIHHAINVRLHDETQSDQVWQDFLSAMAYHYQGYHMNFDTVMMAHAMLGRIIGASLLGFSAILVFVGAFVIYSVLKKTVLLEMPIIGILKASGFLKAQIRWRYMLQFLLIALVSVMISSILGAVTVRFVGVFMMRNLGLQGRDIPLGYGFILSTSFMLIVVFLSSWFASKKAAQTPPIQCLQPEGLTTCLKEQTHDKRTAWLYRLPATIHLGIKQTLLKKGQTVFAISLAFFTTFTIFYGVSGIVSLDDAFDNMAFWGEDNRDITLTYQDDAARSYLDTFLAHEDIKAFSLFAELPAAITFENDHAPHLLSAFVYDDFTGMHVQHINGTSPTNDTEIAISTVLAESYQLSTGDDITLVMRGDTHTFMITGVYQTVVHMGQNVRIHAAALNTSDYSFNTTIITLNDAVFASHFISQHQASLEASGIHMREGSDMQGVFAMLSQILSPVMMMIGGVFIVINIIILSNFVWLNMHERKKDFGVFKSFGMTTNQIRMVVLTQHITTTTLGGMLGIIVGIFTVPIILLLTMQNFGFVNFPFVYPWLLSLLIPLGLLVIVFFFIWLSTRAIKQISVRYLISD